MKSIWTVGELIMEIMRPRAEMPHGVAAEYIGPFPSGAPGIMISSAARMGGKTVAVGGVGKDAFGDLLVGRLTSQGVDCRYVNRSDTRSTGVAFVMYHDDGSREFIYHIDGSAATDFEFPTDYEIEEGSYLHLMGCTLTVSEEFCRKIVDFAMGFVAKGGKISFDPNLRPELLRDGDLSKILKPIIDNTNVFLPGVDELLLVSGRDNIEDAVKKIFENPKTEIIVLKNGSKGCKVFTREGKWEAAAYKVVQKDATGAGDSFDGAFLAGLTRGLSYTDAAKQANAAGALDAAAFGPMEGEISIENANKLIESQ